MLSLKSCVGGILPWLLEASGGFLATLGGSWLLAVAIQPLPPLPHGHLLGICLCVFLQGHLSYWSRALLAPATSHQKSEGWVIPVPRWWLMGAVTAQWPQGSHITVLRPQWKSPGSEQYPISLSGFAAVTSFAVKLAYCPRDKVESGEKKNMSKGKIKPTPKYYFANSLNFAINKDCKWEENAQNENKLSE